MVDSRVDGCEFREISNKITVENIRMANMPPGLQGTFTMKRWTCFYVWARRLIGIGIMIVAILLAALYFVVWWHANSDCGYSRDTVVSKDRRFEAIVAEKCCDWGCRYRISLRETGDGDPEVPVFIYDPTESVYGTPDTSLHIPVVSWLGPDELQIEVDRVGEIRMQLKEAHGVKIVYRIGHVDYP
ncbi:MAG: hypothetical protein ACP5SH_16260 [Syntrophobacteraceae bacterium]